MIIDAKVLWTKIWAEYKTEKRRTMSRTGARVYWVTSGHLIADGLTKASHKNPSPNINVLYYVLEK